MAKQKVNLREKLHSYKYEFDILQEIPCSKEENQEYQKILKDGGVLPKGVFAYSYDGGDTPAGEFYTVYKAELTEEEIAEYFTYKKLRYLKTIKNCVVFFTVLSIITMLASLIIFVI